MLKFIIKRRTFISMTFIALTMLGYISYSDLDLELLPGADLPFLIVQVGSAREMDPEYIEQQAVIPLESAVGTLESIDKIESYVERRQGRIIVYYNTGVDLKYAYLKLQEKVDNVKSTLPADFSVLVLKIDTQQLSNMFMNLQILGEGDADRIRNFFESNLRDDFESIDGIANVEVFGGHEKSVKIIIDPAIGKAYNLTPARIRNLIARNNQEKLFLGRVKSGEKKIFVNLKAEYREISDLENIVVDPAIPLLLRDVATIEFSTRQETSISRVNGQEAVTVQLIRDTQVNLIDLAQKTRKVIDNLNDKYEDQGVRITIQQDMSEFLETNLDLIRQLAVTGGLIAIVILWFFLRNIRLVMVIGLAVPISVFTSFNLFLAFGITLNSLTLVGMALAIGMLLDNSIVVLENIYRKYQHDDDPLRAVIEGTTEIWRSIFAATLTTIIVFFPFIFASNFMIKIIGYQIGVSIISTLVVSLFVALILIPMVTYYFLEKHGSRQDAFTTVSLDRRFINIYSLLLKSCIRFPLRTVVNAVIIFFASVLLALALSLSIQEETKDASLTLYVTMPTGSTLESTDLAVKNLEEQLEGIEETEEMISQVYEQEAILNFTMKEDYETISGKDIADVKTLIQDRAEDFTEAEVSFDQPGSSNRFRGGGGNANLSFERLLGVGGQNEEILIKGRDFEIMKRVAEDIQYRLENLTTIDRVRINVPGNRPEVRLLFDKKLMEEYGITTGALMGELASFQSENVTGIKYRQGTEEYDIIIMEEEVTEKSITDLQNLLIPSADGSTYPLDQLTRIVFAEGRSGINRVNQERQITLSYRFITEVTESSSFLETSRSEVAQVISGMEIPAGIAVEHIAAEAELSDFYFLIGVAFLLIYMVLASVFESLLNPFVIMFTIPLAAIGSLWAIIFTGSSLLNANTLVGFLILLGIVVNNGIILIDYTRLLRQSGFNRSRALMVAGRARLRPIMITALTTIAAMMPLAMGKVEYITSIAAPFAITVIGGLSLSTVFTLILVPTVYSGIEIVVNWFNSLSMRLKLLQITTFLAGAGLIYFNVESLVWQFADLFAILLLIPGLTYFVMQSLRQAKTDIIPENESVRITIRNLYKIYDQPGRFSREWKRGIRTQKARKQKHAGLSMGDRIHASWQLILLTFLIYFVYFYLDSRFWIVVLLHPLYFFGMFLMRRAQKYLHKQVKRPKWLNRIILRIDTYILWIFPALNLAMILIGWDSIVTAVLLGITWYFALIVYTTSNRLRRKLVNINRLKGRFAGLRKRFYRLILIIPVLGKKKVPFRALSGISLQIDKGMFGLLGPNGAGKSTLMRIVCGILDQSYGLIRINDINLSEKREELQGLIGYLPQDFGTYENLTADEFLDYQAILKGLSDVEARKKRIEYVLSAVHMKEHRGEKIGSYSGGMKQRIGIAQTLLHLPRILVVDEPTAGLDPRERIRFRNLLVELSRERIVLFSTHIIEDVASSCDKVAVLNRGTLKYLGAPVNMARKARGHVWQCSFDEKTFSEIQDQHRIVHHFKTDDLISARILAADMPFPDAVPAEPSLEDAYLWLLDETQGVVKDRNDAEEAQ